MADTPLTKVVVDRNRWLRNEKYANETFLLRSRDGKMCCLGFACLAKGGLSEQDIEDVEMPYDLEDDSGLNNPFGAGLDGQLDKLAGVNDDAGISDAVREVQLIALGPSVGLDFEFVN